MSETPDLIDAFVRGRKALLREADAIAPQLRTTPFVGHWSLMDLLAHLVGWDYTNIDAIEAMKMGSVPSFYGHYDPGWAAYNQQLVDRYGTNDWEELREGLRRSQEAAVAMLRSLTPEDFAKEVAEPGRSRPITIAAIVRAAIRDEREHLAQIQAFAGSQPSA